MCISIQGSAQPRWASLDICSDYYLALFSKENQDIVLSSQAKNSYSFPLNLNHNVKFHRGSLEEIYRLKADMVFYTDLTFNPLTHRLSEKEIITYKWPWSLNKEALKKLYTHLGQRFQNSQKAVELNNFIDNKSPAKPLSKNMALMGVGGFIVGQNTHYDILFKQAGVQNYYQKQGYGQISIEDLAMNPPDYIVTFRRNFKGYSLGESFFDHPLFKKRDISIIDISEYFLVCPSHEMLKAAEYIREQL